MHETGVSPVPGWRRLFRHSTRLGLRWLRGATRWRDARGGLARLLVPLDPWRYWELGRLADVPFAGRCLDVSSPKLLPSLLTREGAGAWVAGDLFHREVARWRRLDPSLTLAVCDGRALPFPEASFDHAVCVSVLEHIAGDGDVRAMDEIWRVLKPDGVLHLTTNVAREPREIWTRSRPWGAVHTERNGLAFFERHYGPDEVAARLLRRSWDVLTCEWVTESSRWVEDAFVRLRPFSYLLGRLLRFACPGNFRVSETPSLKDGRFGVVYLRLRKPAARPSGFTA